MSIIEKQADLGRTLLQINANTLRGIFESQGENASKYFELNRSYAEKLPEVKGISDFFALQREYNESIWMGIRTSVEAQTELVKEAIEESGDAIKTAFQPEEAKKAA